MDAKNGGSAFPIIPPLSSDGYSSAAGYPYPEHGMTLRDWFAGQALAEFATIVSVQQPETMTVVAGLAYQMADAMLAERSKP